MAPIFKLKQFPTDEKANNYKVSSIDAVFCSTTIAKKMFLLDADYYDFV